MKHNHQSMPEIDGFIFDLDGTVYLGEAALPGAVQLIHMLKERNKRLLFISNKPLEPRQSYAAKLTRLGMPTSPAEVITSGYVLSFTLAQRFPRLNYYVIGEENLKDEMRSFGLTVLDELWDQDEHAVIRPTGIEAVVVAFDRTLNYRKLNTAYQALQSGCRFFATNPDKTCPMPGGGIPDAGATIAALEHLTSRKVELLAGKPSSVMMEVALETLGLPPERCLLTGDRLETDIRMAKEAGMYAAVVLTGASSRQQANTATPPPDFIFENLFEMMDFLYKPGGS